MESIRQNRNRRGRDDRGRGPLRRMAVVIVILCMACPVSAGVFMQEAFGAAHPFSSTTIYVDGTRTAKFTCKGMTGFCCEAGAHSTRTGTANLSRMKNTSDAAHCAYYYGYTKKWTTGAKGHKMARLLSYCMGNGTNGEFKASVMKDLLKTAKKTEVPEGFQCWHCKPNGSSKQDFIVWKYPKGKLKVLKKVSDAGILLEGAYSLEGITICVYRDPECTDLVKRLTTDAKGATGGTFSLPVGTYYVKEERVPEEKGFADNDEVYKIGIKEGKTGTVTVVNEPETGSLRIRKSTLGEGGSPEGFRFVLTGKESQKRYYLTTGPDGTAEISGLPFGSYTLAEEMTEEQEKYYSDLTGIQELTITKGEKTRDLTVDRENKYEPRQQLKIVKRTGDGGSPAGFSFRISWLLSNSESITGDQIVAAADPQLELGEKQQAGIWQIADYGVIDQINEDAAKGSTGTYEVKLTNTVITEKEEEAEKPAETEDPGTEETGDPEAGEIVETLAGQLIEEISVSVSLRLEPADSIGPGEERIGKEGKEDNSGSCGIRWNELTFAGAAEKGEEIIRTGDSGKYVMDHIRPGEYTVSEEMTDRQKLRYRQPAVQKRTVTGDSDETIVFSFDNEPIMVPVKLRKSSADAKVENVEFTLSGKADYGDEPVENRVVRTDQDGLADFGKLYPGTYTVEETGFDGKRYVNAYPMEGKDRPAFSFRITGDELTEGEIAEGGCLWLGGEQGKGGISKEASAFVNIPYVDLWVTKVDGVSRAFLPGAEFSLTDSAGQLAARFRIDADEEGLPVPVMMETNGVVTGVSAEAADSTDADERAVFIDENGSAGGEDEPVTEYKCVVLRGLIEGERYTLTEDRAPEGFTALEKPYIFSVTLDENGRRILNTCDEYGKSIASTEGGGSLVVVNDAPSIGTVAVDSRTGDHIAEAGEEVRLIDQCRIVNLTKGRTYTLYARLMDVTDYRAGGTVDDVKQVEDGAGPVTGLITFTADAREQTVNIPVDLDASGLKGRTTVIYESLFEGKLTAEEADRKEAISEEADPENEGQTVLIPGIGTTASRTSKGTVRDLVKYENLLPGRTYLMKGRLVDKSTGLAVKGASAEKRFRADESGSGTVSVKFRIDAGALAEDGIRELVAFEKCFLEVSGGNDGETLKRVAAHEDPEDEGQTIRLPGPGSPETGDRMPLSILLIMLGSLLLIAVTAGQFERKQRRKGCNDVDE